MRNIPTYRVVSEVNGTTELFVAWFPSIPGLRTQDVTADAAVRSLFELLPRFHAAMRAMGVTVFESFTELARPPQLEASDWAIIRSRDPRITWSSSTAAAGKLQPA